MTTKESTNSTAMICKGESFGEQEAASPVRESTDADESQSPVPAVEQCIEELKLSHQAAAVKVENKTADCEEYEEEGELEAEEAEMIETDPNQQVEDNTQQDKSASKVSEPAIKICLFILLFLLDLSLPIKRPSCRLLVESILVWRWRS